MLVPKAAPVSIRIVVIDATRLIIPSSVSLAIILPAVG
jgi:hypothetical protein